MLVSLLENELCIQLRDLPKRYNYRYTPEADREFFQILFNALSGRGEYITLFFPGGSPPTDSETRWSLRDAQGAVEGAEYTAAARGKPCGHIFKTGEATYRCKTCTSDDTCVLCARCFDASDHEDHQVFVSVSPGNSGCCDCGDDEAFLRPVHCNIHSAEPAESRAAGKARETPQLPQEVVESIRTTISRTLDYLIDVFSCSPEQLRLPKTEESILEDERTSRLTSRWYGAGDLPSEDQEFALVLWNDEKHTVHDVRDQVARACKQKAAFGLAKAHEVNDIGRSAIKYSSDLQELLRAAKIIEDIKLTVTIRSARDTFREHMGGAIIEWISDIAGCSAGSDSQILRRTVCEELLKGWRVGSEASHQNIGKDGLDDHEIEDNDAEMSSILGRYIRGPDGTLWRRVRGQVIRTDLTLTTNDETTASDDDGEDGAETENTEEAAERMDIDEFLGQDNDGDVEMDPYESDEALEVSEATMAGYPPPPPPPHGRRSARQTGQMTPSESDSEPILSHLESSMPIPATPKTRSLPLRPLRPPKYWLERPEGCARRAGIPIHEDVFKRVRLDHLILYDLRMWKNLRVGVRDVFISTVVSIPEFKRLLGLRFAGVYTALAQLYLIADREPDHSIINLSLQMVTTPSITAEIVERGNFFTNLMAILYTFLTTRQVGYPGNIDPKATLAFEQGAVTNRRMYHFFLDMKYLLSSEHVQQRIREENRYLLQFLDLVKLHQGICPNVRAVGEHLEYETEAWISASLITREINKLCRQFSEAYVWSRDDDLSHLRRAIRSAAKVVIINSLGAERKRFDQSELKNETRFKTLDVFEFDALPSDLTGPTYKVVDYVVAKEPMSFHHALHYTLSWLIDRARSLPRDQLLDILRFSLPDLQEPPSPSGIALPDLQPEEYLLAMFDFPLRVNVWLAQMRAGIWVRNGITLKHQMTQYRSVSQRDVSYQRDIFLLQSALVLCQPSVFLATMIDRFGLTGWMSGRYGSDEHGFEDLQAIDVVEDFVHLLIILLTDRTSLVSAEDDAGSHFNAMRRDIAHVLCFKPLSFSDLTARLSDRVHGADDFPKVLQEMTTFRAPEGLSDTGTFALKEQYIEFIDPYAHQFTRNQREEAENVYKTYMAKKTGKQVSDIVFEPKVASIRSGFFQGLSDVTRQPLFTQVIYYLLAYAVRAEAAMPNIPATRVETYVQFVLQLLLVAILEDHAGQQVWSNEAPESFVMAVLTKRANVGLASGNTPTILSLLQVLLEKEALRSCEPKMQLILHRLRQRQQSTFIIASEALHMAPERMDTASPASMNVHDKELKKKQALERQARVMASFKEQQGKFLANQDIDWGVDDFSDLEDVADPATLEEDRIVKYPSGTCIMCQEETNDQRLYGTFGYVSESSILRQTPLRDADWIEEVAHTPMSLDRSADAIRPFGVASKNRRFVEKINSSGEKTYIERQDLGKGFPCTETKPGPVTTGCGHIMHYSCFEVYLQATQRRHVSQIARNHPERPDFKEFMCPLCKALGNMFLPIIWKGKKASYSGALETRTSFDDWVGSQAAVNLSRLEKGVERTGEDISTLASRSRLRKVMFDYGSEDFIPPVAASLPEVVKSNLISMSLPQQPVQHRFQIPAFLPAQNDDPRDPVVVPPESSPAGIQSFAMLDLVRVYQRLRDTFRANSIASAFVYPHTPSAVVEDLTHTDALAKALGNSISAVEIAQRGVASDSVRSTLLEKIAPQSLTHLRVYSETVSSYFAVGALRNHGSSKTMDEYLDTQTRQLHQLFLGHPDLFESSTLAYDLKSIPPLLNQDPFVFLTECALCLVPATNLDIHHVLRLCYLAEMVRVVIAFTSGSKEIPDQVREHPETYTNASKANEETLTAEQYDSLGSFVTSISEVANLDDGPLMDVDDLDEDVVHSPRFLYFIYTMASTYALAFVRKATILMHVRYGVEFPPSPLDQGDVPELDRLSALLELPSLPQMFVDCASQTPGGHATRSVVTGWIRHWQWAREGKRPLQSSVSLSHPAIFELVGLPKNYDALTDEAIRKRCPTTGKDLTDPCVCLFCGEIMCSQGVCCMTDRNRGGCNKHQAKCGGNIGIFINIRKCMVLFINHNHGTWSVAPYLDKYGEADPTLRRHYQLFLNQKRYDALLRKVWLEGGVQSLIARRLEGDINNGGWETL